MSNWQSKATPLDTQWLSGLLLGILMAITKFEEWPVVDKTPLLSNVLYTGEVYIFLVEISDFLDGSIQIWIKTGYTHYTRNRLAAILFHKITLTTKTLSTYNRHGIIEYFGQWFCYHFIVFVPSSSIKKQSINIGSLVEWWKKRCSEIKNKFKNMTTVIRGLGVVLHLLQNFVWECQKIDWYGVLSSIILLDSCQEGLGEIEARYPKGGRWMIFKPLLQFKKGNDNMKQNISNIWRE